MPTLAWRACLALLSALLMTGNVAAETPAASSYAGGNGSELDPFQISTLAELRLFMETVSFPNSAHFRQTATIDAADTSTWLAGAGWQPVDATFVDSFDGQNHEIQNLYINRPLTDEVGFFKRTQNLCCQELKNIRIVGGQVAGQNQVGGLIGSAGPFTTITNSHSTAAITGTGSVGGLAGIVINATLIGSSSGGTVTGTADFVGGLVGNLSAGKITSSHATGHVTGKRQVGGLVGVFVQGSATPVTLSWAEGDVDGDDMVGGLIGESSGKVTFSYASGAVTATGANPSLAGYAFTGGLIGKQDNHGTEDSWASGAVSGPLKGIGGLIGANAGPILRCATLAGQTVTGGANAGSVGGLVGDNQGQISSSSSASTVNAPGTVEAIGGLVGLHISGFNILTSYATGNVTAAGANKVGGLVGWQVTGQIVGSHAHGDVSGLQDVGGLVGFSSTPAVNNSHATGTVSGGSFVGGLIGNKAAGLTESGFATGAVTGSTDYVGGLIGFNTGVVRKSYAKTGIVTGQQWVGGLVGYNQGTIEESYAVKSVNGTVYVGGLVGQSADPVSFGIKDCYAQGTVSGTDAVGGLVGRNESLSNIARCYASGTVAISAGAQPGFVLKGSVVAAVGGLIGNNQRQNNYDNYWNAQTTGFPGVGVGFAAGATGLTSAQMLLQASFTGFIFPDPWLIEEGVTEPYLDWAAVAVTGTSTTLVSSANPSALGQSVTFTATVTGNAPTGTVLFMDGAVPLSGCIAVTLAANQAQCTAGSLALGSHGISAVYSGDGLNTGSLSPTLSQVVILPTLDVDASITASQYDALTDGLLTLRYLFGRTGTALVTGALGATATRTDAGEIEDYLDAIRPLLDIDDNGSVDAITDGMLILRYLFGLRGNALIFGAFDPLGSRNTAAAIETHIESLLP